MRISRHAKSSMKLYSIDADDIRATLESPDKIEPQSDKMVALRRFGDRFSGYPLKVVYSISDGEAFIITAYPLKRKAWR